MIHEKRGRSPFLKFDGSGRPAETIAVAVPDRRPRRLSSRAISCRPRALPRHVPAAYHRPGRGAEACRKADRRSPRRSAFHIPAAPETASPSPSSFSSGFWSPYHRPRRSACGFPHRSSGPSLPKHSWIAQPSDRGRPPAGSRHRKPGRACRKSPIGSTSPGQAWSPARCRRKRRK